MEIISEDARTAISAACLRYLHFSAASFAFVALPILPGAESASACEVVRNALNGLEHRGKPIPLIEHRIHGTELATTLPLPNTEVSFLCLGSETKSIEKMRDRVKWALWPVSSEEANENGSTTTETTATKALLDVHDRTVTVSRLRPLVKTRYLSMHCIFWSSRTPSKKDVFTHSFDHGGGHFYRYRFHKVKARSSAPFAYALRNFLFTVSLDCPNHFFKLGPRISALKWEVSPEAACDEDCDLPELARIALSEARYKGAHDNVEVYCLEKDSSTVAVEVPIWWERKEMGPFQCCFPPTGPLTGHVDILRLRSDRVEVWDYKPDVTLSDRAGMQVFVYALVLSVRTGIPLARFRCGFFDTNSAWTFDPSVVFFQNLRLEK